MSERSEFSSFRIIIPKRGNPLEAGQRWGRFLLLTFLSSVQRKVSRPAGRNRPT